MNKETESTDYNYEGFVIRIKKSTFQNSYCYLIYLINESGKWKRIRGMEGYSNNKEALLKAQKIGQFGTGLKYTLAYLLRNNIDFKIFSGTKEEKRLADLEIARNEAAEKAIKDAEEKAKRDAEAKLEAERIAKEKEEKRLKRAPDKKLLKDFADNIMFNIAPPADEYLKSDEAKEIVKKAKAMFKDIEEFVKSELEKL